MTERRVPHPVGDRYQRRPAIVYVMGAGRSGSTVLGVALGNCTGVFYAGELEAWLRRSGVPNFAGTDRDEFWSIVRERVKAGDLYGDKAWRELEYSRAVFRVRYWTRRHRLRLRYREVSEALYHTIADSAMATHIVDTSHYPLRALELQDFADFDLYLIFLVRNPLSVLKSFRRRDVTNPSKSVLATNAYLCITNLLSVFVFLRHRVDRRLLLRYEDFVMHPESTMARLLDWAGLTDSPADLASLRTGLAFQGNRLLDSETISLRARTIDTPDVSIGSYITKLVHLPWSVILSALGPRAVVKPDSD